MSAVIARWICVGIHWYVIAIFARRYLQYVALALGREIFYGARVELWQRLPFTLGSTSVSTPTTTQSDKSTWDSLFCACCEPSNVKLSDIVPCDNGGQVGANTNVIALHCALDGIIAVSCSPKLD